MEKQQKPSQVKTARPTDPEGTPRLPHERDESDDSQSSEPRADMQQAAKDIAGGQVDTDLRNRAGGVENVVQKQRDGTPEKNKNTP